MSEPRILDEFPAQQGRPPIYPWDEWMDGQTRELVRGEHFTCAPKSLRTLIHRTARMYGLYAVTHIPDDGHIVVQFYERD